MKYEKTKGIVLNSVLSKESDKSIVIYTEKFGKISAVVPGAAKPTTKLFYSVEPMCETEFIIYLKKNFGYARVTSAVLIDNFAGIRTDFSRMMAAYKCLEFYNSITPFYDANEKKYSLLKRTLSLLETVRNPLKISLAFSLRFLKYSGYDFYRYYAMENNNAQMKEVIEKFSTLSGADADNYAPHPQFEQNLAKMLSIYVSRIKDGARL